MTGHGVRGEDDLLCWLSGEAHVEAGVLGLRVRAHASSFFQGNRFLLEPLVREVLRLVSEAGSPVLDLYAGVGGTWFSEDTLDGLEYEPWRVAAFAALEWRPWRAWSFFLETDAASRLVTNVPNYPSQQWYLNAGLKWEMRPGTTLMDVAYRVNDPDDATVKVRALAFVDGVRSCARPEYGSMKR